MHRAIESTMMTPPTAPRMAISGRADDGVLVVTDVDVGEIVDVGKLAAGSRVVDDRAVAVDALVTVRPQAVSETQTQHGHPLSSKQATTNRPTYGCTRRICLTRPTAAGTATLLVLLIRVTKPNHSVTSSATGILV